MLLPGAIVDNTYRIECELGKGGTAIVYLAYHLRLQKYVVLKNILINLQDTRMIRNEVDTLKELHHTALPQVYDFLSLPDGIFTVMDYIDGEDLEKCMLTGRVFTPEELLQFTIEIAEVLSYLHQHQPPLLHSDLKPGNVMLRPDGTITLIDFNISVWLGGGILGFTGGYASPEQCAMARMIQSGRQPNFMLDGRSDLYSLGATMYYMMTGIEPAASEQQRIPLSAFGLEVPVEYQRIIEKCMAWNPDDRWNSADELLKALYRLRRLGSDFRKKCLMQAAAILICGAMIIGGGLCITKGIRQQQDEHFLAEYNEVLELETPEEMQTQAIALLNTNNSMLTRQPELRYSLLLAAGKSAVEIADSCTDQTDRTNALKNASADYLKAAQVAWDENLDESRNITIQCADLMLQLEDASGLSKLSSIAAGDRELSEILSAESTALNGNPAGARETLEQLLPSLRDRELCWSCNRALAEVALLEDDTDAAITYLQQADAQQTDAATLQSLGQLLMKKAKQQTDAETKQQIFAQAADCFEEMIQLNEAGLTDQLNYAASSINAGEAGTVLDMLENLGRRYPDDFSVCFELAMAYDAVGNSAEALQCARQADTMLHAMSDNEQDSLINEDSQLHRILSDNS